MKKTGYLLLLLAALLLLTFGCSSNKKEIVPVVIPPTHLELARAAADSASSAFTDMDYVSALAAFTLARDHYILAAPTASPTDSVDVNTERIQLNIALTYMNMASESVQASMYEDALTEYESAANIYKSLSPLTISTTERDGYVAILFRNMAVTSESAGQYERALGYYDVILTYEPGSEEILNIKYHLLKDKIKDEVRAIQVLKDYAEASQNSNAYQILAKAYKDNGDNATAGLYYDRALELSSNPDVFIRVADFYRETGNYQKSNTILEQFVATTPEFTALASAYRAMAGNYDKLKNNAKKIEFYEKAFAIDKTYSVAITLANHYHQAKNWDRVINYATQAINLESAETSAFLLRGNAYYQKKMKAAALTDLTRIQNDPKNGKSARDLLVLVNKLK